MNDELSPRRVMASQPGRPEQRNRLYWIDRPDGKKESKRERERDAHDTHSSNLFWEETLYNIHLLWQAIGFLTRFLFQAGIPGCELGLWSENHQNIRQTDGNTTPDSFGHTYTYYWWI